MPSVPWDPKKGYRLPGDVRENSIRTAVRVARSLRRKWVLVGQLWGLRPSPSPLCLGGLGW